jgi:threonine aldolase
MNEDHGLRPPGPGFIDLRSDTVTQPTPAMRRAMAEAEVGDDVYSEDPTVNRLQEMAAERLGKEAALLVLSGTMGNLVSLLTFCGRGEEAILGERSHTYLFEQGGTSGVGGIHPHPIPEGPDGRWDVGALAAAIRPDDEHVPRTRVICLENTHNGVGGRVLPPDYLAAIGRIASAHSLKLHVDGARIFNAEVALGVPAAHLAHEADSLTFCLTKGLACPVGSLIVGDAAFIKEARRNRKILGGGMRQAGVFAAAGIVALNEMVDRLADDHSNARRLAQGLGDVPGIAVDPAVVETNIVFIELEAGRLTPADLARRLRALGVVIGASRLTRIRLVTHYGISATDIDRALLAFERAMKSD